MMYAEWSGRMVEVYDERKYLVRRFHARDTVVGVQVSGFSPADGQVAITMVNGKTDLYKTDGALIRRG